MWVCAQKVFLFQTGFSIFEAQQYEFKQLGKSMLCKHNTYTVLILHPLSQAVAKLVGFFKGILTICSCCDSSKTAQTEQLNN